MRLIHPSSPGRELVTLHSQAPSFSNPQVTASLCEDALPCRLSEPSRVMAAKAELGDPPPGAEQCIRWTLSIPHIPPPSRTVHIDVKGEETAMLSSNEANFIMRLHCVCKPGYRTLTTDRAKIICQACPSHKPAVTKDGFDCISCPGGLTDEGNCKCPTGNILVERNVSGNLLEEARCEACHGNGSDVSKPNSRGDSCERCQTPSCSCEPPNIPRLNIRSTWFANNLNSAAAACRVFSDVTACQALGNMCVMNMHSVSRVSNDACGLFNTIFRAKAALRSNQGISYWKGALPWLYYGNEPGLATQVLQTPVPAEFSFAGGKNDNDIKLIAAVYNVRGQFLRWENVAGGNLQLCPDSPIKKKAAFSFGTVYTESCDLSVEELVHTHPEPLFYDVFLELRIREKRKLLPVPTKVDNQQYKWQFINQDNMKNWYLTRRMFVVDALSGREKNQHLKVIRVANSIKIRFQLAHQTREGQIYTPLMTVEYKDVPITDIKTQTVSAKFAVEYEMDQKGALIQTKVALGMMGCLALLNSLRKTISWKRRMASLFVDTETILKFLLFFAGDLANVFFVVTVGTGLKWLLFYKGQHFVVVLLPLPSQEEQFVSYISWAFVLKAIQFLHKLVLQLTVDVFFIDWEKPRSNKAMQATNEAEQETHPVSIWRTYFVAKEWMSLQTIRKINPTLQIVAVLFCLEVLGFSDLALRDPWSTLQRSPKEFTPPNSVILRYGVATMLWLCIGVIQAILAEIYAFFVEDKVRQFVDLCSTSNISVVVLTHRCFGYYIHGHSVHGYADTNMEEMNNNLKREAGSMVGQRGLLPHSDIQTFEVSLTEQLGQHHEKIRCELTERSAPVRRMDASIANKLEEFLHAHRTDYVVQDKNASERLLGMERLHPAEQNIFYNDDSHSYSKVLFYGNETTLLIFDTLFFCLVDLASQNFVLAAVLTYLQQMIFRWIRNSVGRRNLLNKALLDERLMKYLS
ncbi:meckelin-like [Aulostomus maculatus]